MSPARRRLFQILGLAALLAVLAVAVVVVTGGDDETPDSIALSKVPQDQPGPVVLVPGYGGSTTSLQALAQVLRAAGRPSVVVSLPGEGTDDLTGYVPVLDAVVQAQLAAGAPSVDIVGYSAGGVVARLWAKQGGADLTRRVVTLGSPHHGTRLAATATVLSPGQCPTACQQLVPSSPLLDDLNAIDETPDGPAWLSIWTSLDETVTPPDSARLQGAVNLELQDLCPGARTEHSDLPRDPTVQALVLAALGTGPIALPAICPS